jgi:hypothetical protein
LDLTEDFLENKSNTSKKIESKQRSGTSKARTVRNVDDSESDDEDEVSVYIYIHMYMYIHVYIYMYIFMKLFLAFPIV